MWAQERKQSDTEKETNVTPRKQATWCQERSKSDTKKETWHQERKKEKTPRVESKGTPRKKAKGHQEAAFGSRSATRKQSDTESNVTWRKKAKTPRKITTWHQERKQHGTKKKKHRCHFTFLLGHLALFLGVTLLSFLCHFAFYHFSLFFGVTLLSFLVSLCFSWCLCFLSLCHVAFFLDVTLLSFFE